MSFAEWKPRKGLGRTVDESCCRAGVWGCYGSHQCTRKASVDGKWCKQHAPKPPAEGETWYCVSSGFRDPAAIREVRVIVKPKTLQVVAGSQWVGHASRLDRERCDLYVSRREAAVRWLERQERILETAERRLEAARESAQNAKAILGAELAKDEEAGA